MHLDRLHAIYRRHLGALRRSPPTIEFYRQSLIPLERFMVTRSLEADTDHVTRLLLLELQEHLELQGVQAGGIHAVLRGLRATFRWVLEEELIGEDPTKRLRFPSLPKEAPPAIQPDEVALCLKTAATLPQPLRNRAILMMLYDCGLRMGELLALECGDVDLETGVIRIRAETAKRQKARVLPVGIKVSRAISNYERRERKPVVGHIRHLFLSRSAEPMTKGVLTHLMFIGTPQELHLHNWQ